MTDIDTTADHVDKTILLTLGRLPVALEIARAFHQQGWRVVVAETLDWHLCRLSKAVAVCHTVVSPVVDHRSYKRQLLEIVRVEQVSLVLPVSEEILYVSRIKEHLPSTVTLLAMSSAHIDQLHDKWFFARWAMHHKLQVVSSARADSDAAKRLMMKQAYVLKPRLSCSGVGVFYGVGGRLPAENLLNKDHLVQEKLADECCSSFVMSCQGKCLVMVTYQSLLDSGSVSVRFEHVVTPSSIRRFNESVVSRLNYSGMISFDFMQNDEGQWRAIECNPRATSGLHFVNHEQLVAAFLAMKTVSSTDYCALSFSESNPFSTRSVLPIGTTRQEFWSALTETQGQLLQGSFSVSPWRQLLNTKDVSWSQSDWKPCLLMTFASWQLLWQAIRKRKPISQVVMLDVGCYAALEDGVEGKITPRINIGFEIPAGYEALVESVTFGTDGLLYQRRNAGAQINRFHEPAFVTAHVDDELVGVYVLDRRKLKMQHRAVTGFYRGVLAVAVEWQGRGLGLSLTNFAMTWLDKQAESLQQPVLSYGCIETGNLRSLSLLEKQGARAVGELSMFMMYRQWPSSKSELHELTDDNEDHALLEASNADCTWRDVTPSFTPRLAIIDEHGIRISASVSPIQLRIVAMGFWLNWICRLLVTPWPPARKRFNPEYFHSIVFSRIAVRSGCESEWPDFVSAVLAKFGAHFGTVYSDPMSNQFSTLLRTGWLNRKLHADSGSIKVITKIHDTNRVEVSETEKRITNGQVELESLDITIASGDAHALFPVDS